MMPRLNLQCPYLTLVEVIAEVKRTGNFPTVLSYYLSPTWGQLRVRLIKIDGEFHVIEGGPWHGFGILPPFGLSPDGNILGLFFTTDKEE